MPASTLDPVNAAIRSSLSKTATETNLDVQLAGATKKALLADIEFEVAGSYQASVLDKLKTKYIVLKSTESQQTSNTEKMGADETLTLAKHELYPLEAVQLGWSNNEWAVGAGMVNMGNTCYLNSTLQALFHVPALVNWLISDKQHMSRCEDSGSSCIICAMRKTLQDSQQRNTNSIRPFLIYNKLRLVCRNMIPGRQEDAHEFLRYLVEAMEKAYLRRFKNHSEFDSRTKETTPLNQILGGYLRSAVRCLECGHVSTTFQHFQDLLLDIRKAQTLEEALDGYFSREKLDDESYHCESCQKKVPATKQFSLERAPMVLCIQLKRFSVSNNKITKHVQFRPCLELTKFARHRTPVPLVYRFVALVTHMGPTVGCGHYTAVAQAPCGNYYQFDDSMVRPISHQAVFSTNAYIMLYELECPPFAQRTQNNCNSVSAAASSSSSSSSAVTATCSPGKVKAGSSSTSNSDNPGNGGPLTVHNHKIQQSDRSNSPGTAIGKKLLSSNNNNNNGGGGIGRTSNSDSSDSGSIGSGKLQVNGSSRRAAYGPDLPSDLDMLETLTTAATATTTTVTTIGTITTNIAVASSSEQNGAVSTSADAPTPFTKKDGQDNTKMNATNSIGQRHYQPYSVATSSLLSLSMDERNDTGQQQPSRQSTKHVHQAILPTLISRNRTVRQQGDASTSSSSQVTQFACNSDEVASNSSSPARSCSSSSVSSLSSNVDRGGSSSPKATNDSPKTGVPRSHRAATKLLVPYDVDDDDDDEDDDDGGAGGGEEEEDQRTFHNEIDVIECENSNGGSSSGSENCTFVDKGGGDDRDAIVTVDGSGGDDNDDDDDDEDNTRIPRVTTTTITTVTTSTTCTTAVGASKTPAAFESGDTARVPTKATTADWQVTSSIDRSEQIPSSEGRSWNKKNKGTFQKEGAGPVGEGGTDFLTIGSTSVSTVSELLKMSHVGYSAPVSSWNGTRAGLNKEIAEERREDRKRALCDNTDRGRVKHIKTNSSSLSSANNYGSSNPGYNRLQEYHNAKNSWNNQQNNNGSVNASTSSSASLSSYGGGSNVSRQFYNTSGKHRNRRNNFHHKNGGNYHKNSYTFRQ